MDYRKDLIMVPSCDNHNGVKSKDDEFFLMYMAANAFSNGTAYIHQATKLERILKRTPHIWAMLMATATPAFVKGQNGQKSETCVFHIDWARFYSQFEHIARGLYYHHFQVKSPADVTIIPVAGVLPANSKATFIRQKYRGNFE